MRQLLFIIRSFAPFIRGFIHLNIFLAIKACPHAGSAAAFLVLHGALLRIWRIPIIGWLGEHAP